MASGLLYLVYTFRFTWSNFCSTWHTFSSTWSDFFVNLLLYLALPLRGARGRKIRLVTHLEWGMYDGQVVAAKIS